MSSLCNYEWEIVDTAEGDLKLPIFLFSYRHAYTGRTFFNIHLALMSITFGEFLFPTPISIPVQTLCVFSNTISTVLLKNYMMLNTLQDAQ